MPTFAADSIVPVLLAAIPLLAGGLLLIFLRTRRVACPATCRRCGYDVSQRPADSARCSECGADLVKPKATRTKRRVRAPRATALAVLLVVAGAVFFGDRARRFGWADWYLANAPDNWIAAHAERGTGPFATRAFNEWLARYHAGLLPTAARARFFDHLLAWQDDLGRPWNPVMGDLLFDAAVDGRLSDAQASRFALGATAIRRLRTRQSIRPGDPVAIEYDTADRGISRLRSGYRYIRHDVYASFRGPPDGANDRPLVFGGHPGGWSAVSSKIFRGTATPQGAGTTALSPGETARLHLLVRAELHEFRPGVPDRIVHHRADLRETRDVQVLPRGTPLGRPVKDPSVTDAVARAVRVSMERDASGQTFVDIRLDAATVDRAFDVYVAVGASRRRLLARRRAPANETDTAHDQDTRVEELAPFDLPPGQQSMRLLLVSSGEVLREAADQDRYWSGTLVFPSVFVPPAGSGVRELFRLGYDLLPED